MPTVCSFHKVRAAWISDGVRLFVDQCLLRIRAILCHMLTSATPYARVSQCGEPVRSQRVVCSCLKAIASPQGSSRRSSRRPSAACDLPMAASQPCPSTDVLMAPRSSRARTAMVAGRIPLTLRCLHRTAVLEYCDSMRPARLSTTTWLQQGLTTTAAEARRRWVHG